MSADLDDHAWLLRAVALSRPTTCTQLVLAAGLRRVVYAYREPTLFVANCQGVEVLAEHGVTVVQLRTLAAAACLVNQHLDL
ncbi:hypothetical protein [Kutzneria chonburiensis]|uniref:Uncharacterized protein n=1 Tax=Kutzneria chonburiensis TaxID=1483604 RepID=A0ABV6N142_9PSEU|nr:hypothetical protein [Kutzneria chonburiensis]